jgi:uncharacterized protein (TIGR02145 family)
MKREIQDLKSIFYLLALVTVLTFSGCRKKLPKVSTIATTDITYSGATSGGNVTDEGDGIIKSRGIVWGKNDPTIESNDGLISEGTGTGLFKCIIMNLEPSTDYYVRAFASNEYGTSYGNKQEFKTLEKPLGQQIFNPDLTYGTVSDIEHNSYKTIAIGSQVWFAENLKTTKYNDGTAINLVTENSQWLTLITPAYCWYDNSILNKEMTGAKYNWWVASSGKVCPIGWHVPTDAEFTVLTDYLGGLAVAGGKLKETGTTHWLSPNTGATNSSGFTSLPGGQRTEEGGSFAGMGFYDIWWSSTEDNELKAWYRSDSWNNTQVFQSAGSLKTRGFSIRCVKN